MSRKIIGITVGTQLPKPNFKQTDPTKGDYIKNKPDFDGLKSRVDTISDLVGDKSVSEQISASVENKADVEHEHAYLALKSNNAELPVVANWIDIAYGNGKFVAITNNSNVAAYSLDGFTWHSTTLPKSAYWRIVAHGGDKFVAFGTNGVAACSVDGITWVETEIPINIFTGSVTYNNGKFVAVGHSSTSTSDKCIYSTDGITWTSSPMPKAANWESVTYGGDRFIAVAPGTTTTRSAAYSLDGITWESLTLPVSASCVAYGNGKFVALNTYAGTDHGMYSEDGITWNTTTTPCNVKCICYANDKFVATNAASTTINDVTSYYAMYSYDGITWTRVTVPTRFDSMAYGSGILVSIEQDMGSNNQNNTKKIFISKNGIDWVTSLFTLEQSNADLTDIIANTLSISGAASGSSGISPVISVSDIEGGNRLTITDVNGVKTFDVMHGENGNGIKSAVLNADYTLTLTFDDGTSYTTPNIRGEKGADGYTPVKGTDYFTNADKSEIATQAAALVDTPVKSVNGKTGEVVLSASDVKARPDNWMPTAQDVGALPSTYTPPTQTAEQVGADPKGTATAAVSQHNTANDSHNDIRLELKDINDRLIAFFDSDDKTLDELSEIVAYITNNKTLIDNITTSKVSVTDIIDNLTTNISNKPLSAAQGIALKGLIDALEDSLVNYQPKGDYALASQIPTKVSQLANDNNYLTSIPDEYVTETELNEKGYLTQHQSLDAYAKTADLGALAKKDSLTAAEVGALPADTVIPTVPTNVSAFTNDAGYLTTHQDISGKLDASELPTAINTALAQAKASGEFDGTNGVSATHSWNGTVLTVTSASGTSSADLKGDKGDTGENGHSPVVTATKSGTVTSIKVDGVEVAKINDGTNGQAGSNGKDGTSVTVSNISESTADGGSNVVTFSDGKTLTVKNGNKGSTGSKGDKGDSFAAFEVDDDGNLYVYTSDSTDAENFEYNETTGELSYVQNTTNGSSVKTLLGNVRGNMSLGVHTDGLVYLFINGKPVGNGIALSGVMSDIVGNLDSENNILLSGDIADGTYTLKWLNDDGTYSDAGSLVVSAAEPDTPSYTNLADPTSADWQEGYRLSISAGATSALEGHTTTNYIPFKSGDVLRVKGLAISSSATTTGDSSDPKVIIYNSSKTKIVGAFGTSAANSNQCYGSKVTVEGDISTYTPLVLNDGTQFDISNAAFIRFDGILMDGYTSNDVIITVNQEITD